MPQFKLLGVDQSILKPRFKQEVTVEGLGDAKLLLVQVGKKLTAISPKCTHYGAPLVKGTLTSSGRIKCPWHGACFNATTGDIEDAPGLDALHSFPVIVSGNDLIIEAEESQVKAFSRVPTYTCSQAVDNDTVLVVGGGSGAIGAIEGLREYGYTGKIVVLSKETHAPIDRTKLSKALSTDPDKLALRNLEFFKDLGVDFQTSTVVKSIDFDGRSVSTEDGKIFKYNKIILATGATPRNLPLKGFKELGNIFVIRTINDAKAIVEAVGLEGGKNIVVIGSSFIGMEVANFLTGKNHKVTVIGMEKAPMERIMGSEIGTSFRAILEKKGVKFHMEASVEAAVASSKLTLIHTPEHRCTGVRDVFYPNIIHPAASNGSLVGTVVLKDGTSLEADAVILGVGVAPVTDFAGNIPRETDGSLRVDENFQICAVKDAYAIGDIATYPYKGPGSKSDLFVRIEHWNVAQNGGRSAAKHIATGKPADHFIPIFWSAIGIQLRYCGSTFGGYDDIVIQGNLEENKFVAYYTQGEIVVAVASMQRDPLVMQCSELMRTNSMPRYVPYLTIVETLFLNLDMNDLIIIISLCSKTEIQKGVDVMEIEVPA
ncbi:hypothetical protein H072_2842 [Dactylellina haptotyla CBS 200.50]|uniref:Rieske domain-containing protein n=1 Tax=Dactylellina haptotyla (strain CBS 200.50) TaxID=1284197 RepID=S8AJN8_DACHA|nr:hypothetical protein H072_2842 [Dactylellina haptotyla CBS 200.50]